MLNKGLPFECAHLCSGLTWQPGHSDTRDMLDTPLYALWCYEGSTRQGALDDNDRVAVLLKVGSLEDLRHYILEYDPFGALIAQPVTPLAKPVWWNGEHDGWYTDDQPEVIYNDDMEAV